MNDKSGLNKKELELCNKMFGKVTPMPESTRSEAKYQENKQQRRKQRKTRKRG